MGTMTKYVENIFSHCWKHTKPLHYHNKRETRTSCSTIKRLNTFVIEKNRQPDMGPSLIMIPRDTFPLSYLAVCFPICSCYEVDAGVFWVCMFFSEFAGVFLNLNVFWHLQRTCCVIDESVFWICRCFLNLQVFSVYAGVVAFACVVTPLGHRKNPMAKPVGFL